MKKILIVISCLGLGGGERSLINLLNMFDYSKYSVDLLLLTDGGPLAKQIPTNVKILKKEGDFLLSVENSSLPVKISENNYVPTDKAEPRLHGFGLQNIAHIMQKYGYEYTLFYHDARFHFVSILS